MLHTISVIRLAIFVSTVLLCCSVQGETDRPAPGIGQFLDDSGRLSLPEGFSGSLDPAGFEMHGSLNGEPRFIASRSGNEDVVPGGWEAFGGVSYGCNGSVMAIAVASSGVIYLGGDFTVCGGVNSRHVVAYDPSDNSFASLGSGELNGVNGSVSALAVADGDLFVGGGFYQAGGEVVRRIARWDGAQWHALESGGEIGVNDDVLALAASGTDLYVGGRFTQAGGESVNRVVRWDGSQWHALESGGGIGVGGWVTGLAFVGTDLYVGGYFTEAGGQTANRIARWDGSQWYALLDGGNNGVNGQVETLAAIGTDLYAGGYFTGAGGQSINAVARWDGSQWHALGAGVGGNVFSLTASGSDLYAGGNIWQAGGQSVGLVARWDGSQWHALGSGGQNGVSYGSVMALASSGTDVYLGGGFNQAGGESRNHAARWDGANWHGLGSGDQNGLTARLHALAVMGTDLYVGGEFAMAGDQIVNYIARWDGNQWHALESGGQIGVNYYVHALAVDGMDLFVGGLFWQAGGQSASRIARWDGTQWHALESEGEDGVGGGGSFSPIVRALAVSDSGLYVGGQFVEAGGQSASSIARWDGSQWHALESGGENGVGGTVPSVYELAVLGTDLYVGGDFTEAGDQSANNIARWDGSQWHALESGGENGVNGNLASVHALAVSGQDLYVGGHFSQAGEVSVLHLARWDGSQWHQVANLNSRVRALEVSGDALFVGGLFIDRIRRWDGESWATFGNGGVDGEVLELAMQGDILRVGGAFGSAGGQTSSAIAAYWPESEVDLDLSINAYPAQTAASTLTGGSRSSSRGTAVMVVEVDVANHGPDRANGVALALQWSPAPVSVDWTCSTLSSGDATCPAPSGSGMPDAAFDLPAGSGLRFTLEVTVDDAELWQQLSASLSAEDMPGAVGNVVEELDQPIHLLGDKLFEDDFLAIGSQQSNNTIL